MTRLQKLYEIMDADKNFNNKALVDEAIFSNLCPSQFDMNDCINENGECNDNCERCWNSEV